jgi:hypothetical protein
MAQSVPLHYGVYYFRLAHEYGVDVKEEFFMSKNKEKFLSLAKNLLENGHVEEAWFYYYQLNNIAPLLKKNKEFFHFASLARNVKKNINEISKYYIKYDKELFTPYGVILAENPTLDGTKDFFKNYNFECVQRSTFGKHILKVKYNIYSQEDIVIDESVNFLESISKHQKSQSLFKQLLQQQNFVCAQMTLFKLREINQQLKTGLENLRKRVIEAFRSDEDLVSELFKVLLSSRELERINYIANKAMEAQKRFLYFDLNEEDTAKTKSDELSSDYIELQIEQNTLGLKDESDWSNRNGRLESVVNGTNIEIEEITIFTGAVFKDFKEEIESVQITINTGRDILQSILSVNEHYYHALHKQFVLEYSQAKFFQCLKIIKLLRDNKLKSTYRRLERCLKTKVFISYSSKDRKEMRKLKNKLESEGITVNVDENSLTQIELIQTQLKKIIEDSDYFISLISPNSLSSPWVGFEILSVMNEKSTNKFIPIIMDEYVRTAEFREEKREQITEQWDLLRNLRNAEEDKRKSTPSDLKIKLDRIEVLDREFPRIYSEITEKVTLNFYDRDAIEENYTKLLDTILQN